MSTRPFGWQRWISRALFFANPAHTAVTGSTSYSLGEGTSLGCPHLARYLHSSYRGTCPLQGSPLTRLLCDHTCSWMKDLSQVSVDEGHATSGTGGECPLFSSAHLKWAGLTHV